MRKLDELSDSELECQRSELSLVLFSDKSESLTTNQIPTAKYNEYFFFEPY
jgi:hypothetical protein